MFIPMINIIIIKFYYLQIQEWKSIAEFNSNNNNNDNNNNNNYKNCRRISLTLNFSRPGIL